MNITLTDAKVTDAPALAAMRSAVAERLTREFGQGHWSSPVSESGVLYAMRNTRVLVAYEGTKIIGTLQLTSKKPWAIDRTYFQNSKRPIYLIGMAVEPTVQRQGIGRAMIEDVQRIVRGWSGDAVRLDAYDALASAGPFYGKCGFREVGRVIYRTVPLIYYELLV